MHLLEHTGWKRARLRVCKGKVRVSVQRDNKQIDVIHPVYFSYTKNVRLCRDPAAGCESASEAFGRVGVRRCLCC